MSDSQIISSIITGFRTSAVAFACVLGCLAIWILAAELVRPSETSIATDTKSAVSRRDAAVLAAKIGLVRGDLWSEAAFASANAPWQDKNASNVDVQFEQMRAITEQAIARAPHDSRLWLLLAANYFRFDPLNERGTAALKMSFYTGSNTITALPERLLLGIQSRSLNDDDFRDLVRHDIRIALLLKPQMMPALIAAFEKASPTGKQFIEKTVAEFDPSALALIRTDAKR